MAERLSIQIKDEDNVAVAVHDLPAGTRNLLGIVTTVQCVAGVVKVAVERIKKELLPKYPNVDGVVAITHPYGCGVAINAPLAYIPIRAITNVIRHPLRTGRGPGHQGVQPQ